MEYCPRPNLQLRARKDPFSVAEALRVGVQVAGAVETAHRAGVLHRDIKPANILVTEYNRPALTDFGIASTTGPPARRRGCRSRGRLPSRSPSRRRADPARMCGHSGRRCTHCSPDDRRSSDRESATPAPTSSSASSALRSLAEAAGLPESLQRLLERSMAKNPDDRFPSAVAFARALQKVQIELAFGDADRHRRRPPARGRPG